MHVCVAGTGTESETNETKGRLAPAKSRVGYILQDNIRLLRLRERLEDRPNDLQTTVQAGPSLCSLVFVSMYF